ncbi:hypothetical protein SASPL_137338 [Salvia splendens]|uniref:ubiquitinyl hydrolase 1 n=1 Tax=Salvia splendens TaxID=180675 RepID=A0A8X8WV21_SALSN|nr:hypothetical protein SASPL_137338 [Salvia splendens]
MQMSSQKRKTGVLAPNRFVQRLKKQNEKFRSYMHQDAHEFLNYLLNELVDILEKETRAQEISLKVANGPTTISSNGLIKEPGCTRIFSSNENEDQKATSNIGDTFEKIQVHRTAGAVQEVVFPLELKLNNTVEDADAEYSLFAVVVHVGSVPNHGHYVSLVKTHNHWLFFDDENVEMIDEPALQTFSGSAQEYSSNTDRSWIHLILRKT